MFTTIVNIVKMRRNVKKERGKRGTEVKKATTVLKQAFWYENQKMIDPIATKRLRNLQIY